jgi:transposase, IS30 family
MGVVQKTHLKGVPAMASHLTLEEREVIAHMKHDGESQTQIAKRLSRSKSTISRELKRNRCQNGYWAVAGQKKAAARRSGRAWTPKLNRPALRKYVRDRLRQYWSPDEIAARSRMEFPDDWRQQISHQSIYEWIAAQDAVGARWRRFLRRGGKNRPKPENRGRIPGATSIDGRPPVVDRRERYGDWEGDTVVGAGRRGGAVTLVERKSGYTMLGRVDDLKAPTVRQAAGELYAGIPAVLRKTLTLDNGKEFAHHEQLANDANLKIFFAKPYCAWQRGTNENTNGLIRQFFPKGTDLASVSRARFTKVQQLLNNRPRKRLGYLTPCEVLQSRLHVAIET